MSAAYWVAGATAVVGGGVALYLFATSGNKASGQALTPPPGALSVKQPVADPPVERPRPLVPGTNINPDSVKAGAKLFLGVNSATGGAGAAIGGTIGASVGSAIFPVAGTALGGAYGAYMGGSAGLLVGTAAIPFSVVRTLRG